MCQVHDHRLTFQDVPINIENQKTFYNFKYVTIFLQMYVS